MTTRRSPKGQTIQLTAADGFQFDAYVAQPAQPAKAAVVVLQEIFGVNDHIRKYEADHGFNCEQRGSYNAAAALLARQRTLDFFARHLA